MASICARQRTTAPARDAAPAQSRAGSAGDDRPAGISRDADAGRDLFSGPGKDDHGGACLERRGAVEAVGHEVFGPREHGIRAHGFDEASDNGVEVGHGHRVSATTRCC